MIFKLNELCEIKYGKNQKKVQDLTGDIPIYGTGGLMGYANTPLYDKPSVLIPRKGSISNVQFSKKPFWTVDTLFYTIVNEEKVIPKYLYYVLSRIDLSRYNEGTTIPSLRTETLNRIELEIPPLDTQKSIVKIMNSLDGKTIVNQKLVKRNEDLSKLLFKHWFIDFEFPNEEGKPYKSSGGKMVESELGMIPEGWRVTSLESISNSIVTGKTPPTKEKKYYNGDINFLTIPDMHNSLIPIQTERTLSKEVRKSFSKKILPINSIAVSCIATPGLISLIRVPTVTNQQINSLILEEKNMPYVLYKLKTLSDHIKMLGSSGSTTLNLNKTQFGKIKIIYPETSTLFQFNKVIEPFLNIIEGLTKENIKLINLREGILPKLLSGEIEVPVKEPESV